MRETKTTRFLPGWARSDDPDDAMFINFPDVGPTADPATPAEHEKAQVFLVVRGPDPDEYRIEDTLKAFRKREDAVAYIKDLPPLGSLKLPWTYHPEKQWWTNEGSPFFIGIITLEVE